MVSPLAIITGTISIHAPREGSDSLRCPFYLAKAQFLSTLPARGATQFPVHSLVLHHISIHAPREGSDSCDRVTPPNSDSFLSTLPARGATSTGLSTNTRLSDFYPRSPRGERPLAAWAETTEPTISIHAPREGSDELVQAP